MRCQTVALVVGDSRRNELLMSSQRVWSRRSGLFSPRNQTRVVGSALPVALTGDSTQASFHVNPSDVGDRLKSRRSAACRPGHLQYGFKRREGDPHAALAPHHFTGEFEKIIVIRAAMKCEQAITRQASNVRRPFDGDAFGAPAGPAAALAPSAALQCAGYRNQGCQSASSERWRGEPIVDMEWYAGVSDHVARSAQSGR